MKLLKVQEVAERLRLNEQTVYRYIRDGEINYTKIKGSVRVKESELERFINDNSKTNNKKEPVKQEDGQVYFLSKETINHKNHKVTELKNKKKNLENEIKSLKNEINKFEKKIKENIRRKSRAEKWLKQVQNNNRQGNTKNYKHQIKTAENILNNKQPELEKKQDKLEKLKGQLVDVKNELQKYVKLKVKSIM